MTKLFGTIGAGDIGVPMEWKFTEEKAPGTFEGYAAVFGNMDSHGDVIEPGAFAASLLERERRGAPLPTMFKLHGAAAGADADPIGVWGKMSEDANGLYVEGKLLGLDTETGKWNYALLREGGLKGLSIGYKARSWKAGSGRMGEPKRHLKAVALREVSLVDDPSNPYARIWSVKQAGADLARMIDPRALEAALRRELKISGADAVTAVGIVKKHLRDAGADEPETDLREEGKSADLVGPLKRLAATLNHART